MGNLVKMDWYRLRTSVYFIINTAVAFALNLAAAIALPLLQRYLSPDTAKSSVNLSELFGKTDVFPFIFIFMLISLVSFSYSDISHGYIKNIAGQLPNKGYTVISKFIVIAVHNFIFMLLFLVSCLLGSFITQKVVFDEHILEGGVVFLVRWLLTMALASILLFITTGLKSKTFASVLGVLLGSGTLSLVYLGINNIFKSKVDVNKYAPDSLLESVNTSSFTLVLNAVIVSIICIAIFLPITVRVFNKRDVK